MIRSLALVAAMLAQYPEPIPVPSPTSHPGILPSLGPPYDTLPAGLYQFYDGHAPPAAAAVFEPSAVWWAANGDVDSIPALSAHTQMASRMTRRRPAFRGRRRVIHLSRCHHRRNGKPCGQSGGGHEYQIEATQEPGRLSIRDDCPLAGPKKKSGGGRPRKEIVK